jgi:hypothetical protein
MKNLFVGCLIVGGLLIVVANSSGNIPGPNPGPDPPVVDPIENEPIKFLSTDGGDETTSKYFRAYARNLAALARKTRQRILETEDSSYDIAKAWAEASSLAAQDASKGVDARVAELVRTSESREESAAWMAEVIEELDRLGK